MLAALVIAFAAATLWRWVQCAGGDWSRVYFAPDTHVSGLIVGSIVGHCSRRCILSVARWATPSASFTSGSTAPGDPPPNIGDRS